MFFLVSINSKLHKNYLSQLDFGSRPCSLLFPPSPLEAGRLWQEGTSGNREMNWKIFIFVWQIPEDALCRLFCSLQLYKSEKSFKNLASLSSLYNAICQFGEGSQALLLMFAPLYLQKNKIRVFHTAGISLHFEVWHFEPSVNTSFPTWSDKMAFEPSLFLAQPGP